MYTNRSKLEFKSSIRAPGSRAPQNNTSSYIEAASVYGVSPNLSDRLRQFTDGKLKTSPGNLLPIEPESFLAGDSRVSEQPILWPFI